MTVDRPQNFRVSTPNGTAQFEWDASFVSRWQRRFDSAEGVMAKDVLRFSEPFIPKLTGQLIATGEADKNGVRWTVPYARRQYYLPNRKSAGLRGSFWFERMKEVYLPRIVDDASKEFSK